jgi:hypothetical protein
MGVSFSLNQQIEGLTQGLAALDRSGKAGVHKAPLDAAIRTLRWFADCEASLRAWVESHPEIARGPSGLPPRPDDLQAQIRALNETIDRMHDLVGREAANDSQRDFLRGRLEAVLVTLCWLYDNEKRVRAYGRAVKAVAS